MCSHKLFLSYATEDRQRVDAYVEAFRNCGMQVWIDHEQIQYGDSISQRINDAIENSTQAVLFFSHHYKSKAWTSLEKQALIYSHIDGQVSDLVVVKLDDVQLDAILADRLWKRGNDPSELADWFASNVSDDGQLQRRSHDKRIPGFVEDLDGMSIERVGSVMVEALSHNQDYPSKVGLHLQQYGRVIVHLSPNMAPTELSELKHIVKICGIHHKHIAAYREELAVGGLGVFSTSYKIRLQEQIGALDEARTDLRHRIVNMVTRVVQDLRRP